MVADFPVLPGFPGDLLRGGALYLQLLPVLQDHQDIVLPLQSAASTPKEGMQPLLYFISSVLYTYFWPAELNK